MNSDEQIGIVVEGHAVFSQMLQREVWVDVYRPASVLPEGTSLLLLLDGQDVAQTPFRRQLSVLHQAGMLQPLLCAAVYAGPNRLQEYGTAGVPDFAGRGMLAGLHQRFLLEELIPFLQQHYQVVQFRRQAAAGFSLGGLAAMSLVWRHSEVFAAVGAFSGSFWWRSRDLGQGYEEDKDRIMHFLVRQGKHRPGLRFYFTTGSLDETADRNGNGIIDAIDDTLDLIRELEQKGYRKGIDIFYKNFEEGRHDLATWGRALPGFLLWGWGKR